MNRQDQRVAAGSTGIQAARDVNIAQGLSGQQVAEIITALSSQLAAGAAEAAVKFERRLDNFKAELLKELAVGRVESSAFNDPDFQVIVRDAQNAYGRTGDDDTGDVLIKIIGERSKCTERGRLSLTLNKASEIAPELTNNEFAAITLCFIFTMVRQNGIYTIDSIASKIIEWCAPLLPDVPQSDASFAYIASTGCAYINDVASTAFWSSLHATYSGALSSGFTHEKLIEILDGKSYVINSFQHLLGKSQNGLLQFLSNSEDELQQKLHLTPLSEKEISQLTSLYRESAMGLEDVVRGFSCYTDIVSLRDAWENTRLKNMRLTSIGAAIAHANLRRLVPGFAGDLSIWVA